MGGSLSVTLAWNLTNLLPWTSGAQQSKTLEDNLRKLDIAREQARTNAKIEITQKVNALTLARSQIESMQATVDLAQKAYDQYSTMYANGMAELLEVRDSENSLNQAKLGLLNQQYAYLTGLLDLGYAINSKL
jgi:outer membrane protein TolC